MPSNLSLVLIISLTLLISAHATSIIDVAPTSTDSNLCLDFLNNLTNQSYAGPNMTVEINNLIAYSGHNLNDLGYWKVCKGTTGQKYSVMTMVGGGNMGIGVCGPAFCSIDQLQNYSDTFISLMSNITGKDLTAYELVFTDPEDTKIDKGFWLYFTIILLSVLVLLTIIGTISANKGRKKVYEGPKKLQPSQDNSEQNIRDVLALNKDSASEVLNTEVIKEVKKEEAPSAQFRKPMFLRIAECFDLIGNFHDLMKDEKVPGHDHNLNCINGIRTLAFFWVVYGHTFLLSTAAKNYNYLPIFMKSVWILLVVAAFYAVDTFFYLSGFFTGYLMVSKLQRMKPNLRSYMMILFHRWIRLWPAYFVAILFYWKISVYMGKGPLWFSYVESAQYCTAAWKNWLLLDNVLTKDNSLECFGWGWYLAADFQVFLTAPFLCWLYLKDKEKCHKVIQILMIISIIFSYIYLADSNYSYILMSIGAPNTQDYMTDYYTNPIVRMSPYLLGLVLGFMFKEYKDGERNFFTIIKESQSKSIICFYSGIAVIMFLVFYPKTLLDGDNWSTGFGMTWSTFGRPIWGLGIFLVTAPLLVGNLKGICEFLSSYYFTIVARISYSGYLVHLIFLQIVFSGTTQYYGLSQANQGGMAFAFCIISSVGAAVLHLLVEKPITNIETKILSAKKGGRGRRNLPKEEEKSLVVSNTNYKKLEA